MPDKLDNPKTSEPTPYLTDNQFTKSSIDKVWSSIYTLAQFTKLYKKENLMVWSTCSTPLNALPFLSFHKVHRRHKGAALHAFTLLLPTKVSFHPSKLPLTVKCITHCTSKREKIIFHNKLALLQSKKRWLLVSSSSLHKKHLLGMFHPLLFN